jgi:hypothetical protein
VNLGRLGDVRGRLVKGEQRRIQEERAAAGRPHGWLRAIGDISLGDRVACSRIRYEGVGTVVAISNDMQAGSGGTKLYPTLYVELDDGGGGWYDYTSLTRRDR